MQDAETKEFKASATIRFSLDQFQQIHLTFRLPVAIFRGECHLVSVVIARDASSETPEFRLDKILLANLKSQRPLCREQQTVEYESEPEEFLPAKQPSLPH
jgi:hypothetical protein